MVPDLVSVKELADLVPDRVLDSVPVIDPVGFLVTIMVQIQEFVS